MSGRPVATRTPTTALVGGLSLGLAACVPDALPLDEAGGGPPEVAPGCAIGAVEEVSLVEGAPRLGYVRTLDGAVLLARWSAGAEIEGFDAARDQVLDEGALRAARADEALRPCGVDGHLALDALPMEHRVLERACGERADAPVSVERLEAPPTSLAELACSVDQCSGEACTTWLWWRTPRTCQEQRDAFPDAESGERWIDPDGPVGDRAARAACLFEGEHGYTRVLGADSRAPLPEVLGPFDRVTGLERAAAMQGYLGARTLQSWPLEGSFLRFRFACEPDVGARFALETKRQGPAEYLLGRAVSATAHESFDRLDPNSFTSGNPFLWGRSKGCDPSGSGSCGGTGRWGDEVTNPKDDERLAIFPIVIDDSVASLETGWRVEPGAMLCDRKKNTPGTWEVWVR